MMLPNISVAEHRITLPCINREVKYRQYLTGEEKILLLAAEEMQRASKTDIKKGIRAMFHAVSQVLTNCMYGKIEADTLPMFDAEYLLLSVRSKSSGSTQEVKIKCSECGHAHSTTIDLSQIHPASTPDHTNRIPIEGDVGIVMKYPTYDMWELMVDPTKSFDLIVRCVDMIYNGEQVTYAKDVPAEELTKWMDQLSSSHFRLIGKFFESAPRIRHNIEWKCSSCQHDNKYKLEGLQDFFS